MALRGSPRLMLDVLTGQVPLEDARSRGLECEGDVETLHRVLREAPRRPELAT
jgi:hypothetical protein